MKLCILTGSYSIDNHSHTQAETNAMVNAIVAAVPAVQYIGVGTYLDYASDILKWSTSIHSVGKKMWLRSSGYNEWLGTNGVGANNTVTALSNHRTNIQSFITTSPTIFASGDILEAVPDELSAGSYFLTLNLVDNGANNTAYNGFITGSITDCNTALATAGITGVITTSMFNSPAGNKINNPRNSSFDLLTVATANALTVMGGDSYPELSNTNDPFIMQSLTQNAIDRWVNGMDVLVTTNYNYTMGPNVYLQLTESQQSETYRKELFNLQKNITNFDGITIWQAGGTGNPLSRLFDWTNSTWVAREATKVVQTYFAALANTNRPYKRIPLN